LEIKVVAVILVLFIVASAAVGYFAGVNNRQVITTTSTKFQYMTTETLITTGSESNGSTTRNGLNNTLLCSITPSELNEARSTVETNSEFLAAENGTDYSYVSYGMVCYRANTLIQLELFYEHTTNQLFEFCSEMQNVTDTLRVILPVTPSGINMSAIQIAYQSSLDWPQLCTTTISTGTTSGG